MDEGLEKMRYNLFEPNQVRAENFGFQPSKVVCHSNQDGHSNLVTSVDTNHVYVCPLSLVCAAILEPAEAVVTRSHGSFFSDDSTDALHLTILGRKAQPCRRLNKSKAHVDVGAVTYFFRIPRDCQELWGVQRCCVCMLHSRGRPPILLQHADPSATLLSCRCCARALFLSLLVSSCLLTQLQQTSAQKKTLR